MRYIFYILLVIFTACVQKSDQDQKSTYADSIELSAQISDSTLINDESSEIDSLQENEVFKNFPPQKLTQFDFSSIEKKVSDTLKLEFLRKLVFTKYLLPTMFETNESYDFENYHILDFNADSRLDIIYDGRNPMGIETNNVVFFLNKEDSLRPVIKLNGDFTKIEIKDNRLQSFQLIKSPCCANYIYRLENYELNKSDSCFEPQNGNHENYKYSYGQVNEPEFCVSLVSQYAYVMKTEFPDKVEIKGNFAVSNKTFLTPKPYEPTNADFDEDGLAFHFIDNKAISELPQETKCQVLSEKSDGKGNVYCFVVFKMNEKKMNYMDRIDFDQYGWVKKKDLK